MLKKESRLLQLGILGCGPIAQFAHFDACKKAKNVELYAVCDVADDLRAAMAARHEPKVAYAKFEDMLADKNVEAVLIAVADQYHVPLCQMALEAGKHVFVEKPLGVSVEECEALRAAHCKTNLVVQIGNNRRFDPGIAFARKFIQDEVGERIGLKAWYYDSAWRYTMTDNLQPIPVQSAGARRPEGNPKADKRKYFLLTHGSHLVDSARNFGGPIEAVRCRFIERNGTYCWFIAVDYADGCLGNIDLAIAIQGDFEEGFYVYGTGGSVSGKVFLPWFHKSAVVECFSARDRQYHRPLGEDAFTYKLQLEAFADTILNGAPNIGATIEDGMAAMRAMVAIARSAETGERVRLAEVLGIV